MGFCNDVTKWFECYLSNRMFRVHVENNFSDKALVICGVPQGSILGQLLFLLYVNDMVQAVNCDLLLCFMLMTQVLFFNIRTLI